jgi:hypothetical protein
MTRRADDKAMTVRRPLAPLTFVIAATAGLLAGCAGDARAQVDAATSSAITVSLRGLPAVTGATVTESTTPTDTLAISLTTALDKGDADTPTSATALLREAADMAYATRHDTVDAVAVTVYGVDGAAGSVQPNALLAQSTFRASDLAAASR